MTDRPPHERGEDPLQETTRYLDRGDLVICGRVNPREWIRSNVTVAVDEAGTLPARKPAGHSDAGDD